MIDHFADVKNTKALWWRFLLLTLPVIGLVILSSYLFLQSEHQTHLATVRLETAHHIESQVKNISAEIMQAVTHAKFLSKQSDVVEGLKVGDAHVFDELSRDFYSFAKYMSSFDQVRLLDRKGVEVVRANFRNGNTTLTAKEGLQDKSGHAYFTQTMNISADDVFISKFTLNVEHGQIESPYRPVIRYAAPVTDVEGENIGVVVLNYSGDVLIDRYLDATDVTGENMLLNANSFFLHAKDESSTWGSVLDEREDESLALYFPEVWNTIVQERAGQILTTDGLFTFATINPYSLISQDEPSEVGARDWIVVSYVSDSELYADSESSSQWFFGASFFMLVIWMVLAWLWSSAAVRQKQTHLHLRLLHKRKRQLLRKQMSIQEDERRTLARSLHDDMGQSLTSIQAYAAGIGKAVIDGNCEKVNVDIHHIRSITTHIQQSVRSHLHDLRPASLDRLGLSAAIEDMLEEFPRRENIACDYRCKQTLPNLSEVQNIHLFRIVQEALTNVAKYAQASHVTVSLNITDDSLHLMITDDGVGMSKVEENGMGLLGMRERAELLGGEISIESALGEGVTIRVNVPVEVKR